LEQIEKVLERLANSAEAGWTEVATIQKNPWLIHRLTYRRANHNNIHVRGYKEEGTITTPFNMTVLNELNGSPRDGHHRPRAADR
jgi:phosphoketolase